MGRTIKPLSEKELDTKAIFDKRFVVESCESVHFHYRNLRIELSKEDFFNMSKGMVDAQKRWDEYVDESNLKHVELCRKEVAKDPKSGNSIKINLNENLYNRNEGKIFAEGADFKEPIYVHLKIRDLRIELSLDEFDALANCVKEAKSNMGAKANA